MKRSKGHILWVDDEIDHLKSHILFLEERGYKVTPVTNGEDAVNLVQKNRYDLILLDEMLTGMDGLQALSSIHEVKPMLPVIMITKSEEENLMEEAIGQSIEDYLTKPVNPSQILSSCKRILEKRRISREKLTREYTMEFGEIASLLEIEATPSTWIDIHLKLSERELELDNHPDIGLHQTLHDQRKECNHAFGRFIEKNYAQWINGLNRPVLSVDIVRHVIAPSINSGYRVLFVVIDNLRMDQWLTIEPLLHADYSVDRKAYYSILPTATPFSRNALFAGMFPGDIAGKYPELWKKGEEDETSRNRHEAMLLLDQLAHIGLDLKSEFRYEKVFDSEDAGRLVNHMNGLLSGTLTALVINFVDILAHQRNESRILKQIVPDESAYRAMTRNWFERSPLLQILRTAVKSGHRVVLTSDHGSIKASRGAMVYADRETSTNLRYKYGKGIRGDDKQVMNIKDPPKCGLPAGPLSTNYLLAKEDYYLVYPTNYHRYLSLYKDSYQHGGISLQEMILPLIIMEGHENP
ncbi:MAG TPA: response regulator [bacterium]|nr:response regulator [bacterium]